MDQFERGVVLWQRETFPNSTMEGLVAHFLEEVDELKDAIRDRSNVGEEIADCVLLLIVMAGRFGTTIDTESRKKFGEIQGRTYRYDPEAGYEKHVK